MEIVLYKNEIYVADLPVRASLFEDLKKSNPNMEIKILSNQTGEYKQVKISEVQLWGIVRNL
jgi:hypothetical protein